MKFSKFMAAALLAAVVLVPLAARAQDPLLAPFITPGATLTGGTVLVGKTPGEFEVGSNGGASYRIPLVLPPGTSGVVPSLSLGYDSQAGSGLVGPGWILGGLSVVTRCGTHLVPDGVLDPVDFDANDRFCLDGQPLVAVGDGTYRTEIDAFSKVVPSGGTPTNPGKWTVWTKDGKVLEFGGTPNSQIETTLTGAPILVWTLNRSQDRAGNYYTVTYGEVPSYGFFAPLRIDYTGNSVTNLTPYNSVLFHYEARSDKPDAFVGGARTSTPVRLKQIEILAGTTRVRAYDLTYETGVSSTRSRLTQIKECGFNTNGTAACLPSTFVTWQEGVRDFADSSTWLPDGTPSVTNSENKQFIVDINGDAKSDYLWTVGTTMYAGISTGTNFQRVTVLPPGSGPGGIASVPDSIQYMLFGDLNGDGRTDYTWQVSGAWYAALSNGSDLSTLPRTTWLAANAVPGIPSYNPQGKQFLGDFNGDGRSDLVWVQNNAVYVGLSDGTRFVPPTGPWLAVTSGPGGIASVPQFAEDMKFGDLNGDGMTDYMWEVSNAWHVALSTGTQLVVDGTWLPANTGPGGDPVVGTENKEFLADLNGDGYMDFLWARTNKLYGRLSTGKGFASGTTWLAAGTGPGGDAVVPDSLGNMRVDDFNGDHRADYMWMIGGDWHVALSNGQTFDDRRTWIFAGTGPSNSAVYNNGDQFVGDFNGDGLADHMWYAGPGWNVALSAGPVPDLVTQLTDGLGAATNFHYLPLTDPAVYEKGTGAVYPMIDEQYPSYVLADVKVPNGLGGQTTRSFFYEHSRRDVRRGFPFGFESLDDLDQSRGTLTTTVYNQSYPIHGTQSRLEMRNSGGTLRMRTTSTVTPSNNAGATIFRYYVSQNLEEFFEPNGTTLTVSRTTTQQVDAYNNPTVVTSSASDGYGKTTTTTYSNDAVNWLIGMATQVQVVGSAPGVANVTRTTSAQYNTTTGLRTQEIVQPGTSLALTRIFTRDNYGNVTRIATSGTGITARNEDVGFDTKGLFATTETNPLGQVETRTFDGRFGVPLTVRGINGLTTTLSYDPIGRETSRTNPDGTVDTKVLALCPSAAVPCPGTGVISLGSLRSGSPSQYQVMDVLGREVRRSAIGFAGTAIHSDTEYDAMGRVSRKSLPYFQGSTAPWTTFAYDGLDRLITQTEPNGSVTAFGYTGLATAVTNALNQTRTELKNSQDKPVRVTDAAGNFTAYVYDPFGNLLSATDPLGHVLSQTFDALGRRLTLSDPDLGSLTTVSNVLGQPTQETDAKGQVRTLAYDLLGRVTQRTEADGSTTFTYDTAANGVGQLASASGTTAGQSYSRSVAYDASARPSTSTVVVDGRTYATTVQYDSSGRVSGTVYPGGFTTRNLYNTAGHLFRVENASTSAPYWIKEAENAAGQTTQESFGSSVLRTQRTYDPLTQRPTQIRTGPGTSSTVQNLNYAWNAVGVLTQRSDTNRSLTENFQYDSLNRLTQSQVVGQTAITYTYNAVGNLLTKSDVGTYTYGSTAHRHAVTATAGALPRTYTYDANGNQTERFNGSVSVGAMAYTSFDKPSSISATTPGGVQVSQFRYDDGRNLLVRRDIPPAGDTKTTYYAADGAFEEVLYSSGPVEQRHYIRGANGPVGVFTTKTATPSSLRYMLRDHLGSLDVIASDTGAVLESLSYDAFGKRRNANWTPSGTPIVSGLNKGFTNHEELDNVGLVHMGGRVYDPTLGRFLSADPYVQFPYNTQGLNRYSYVLNNPLSFNDPTGFGLGDFFKRLFKKIGTAFKNPRTWLSLAGCITTGSTCYDLGVQLAQAALWGDEVPKSIQRSQRIASALSSLRAPSQRIIGIRNEVKLPDTTDQWADAKNGRGGTILNVENECRSSGTPFCATPSKARTAELTAQFGEGIVIGITLVLESTDKHSRINLDESTITIGFGAAASFRSSGPLSGAPGPLPKLTLPLTAPEPKQPKFFLFNDVSIQHPLYGAGVDVKVMLPSTRPISISPSFGQGFSVIGVGVGASFSGIRDATLTYSEIFEQRANPNDLTPFGGP